MEAPLAVLGLSKKESLVLDALRAGLDTPVKINAKTDVSRPAIYAILAHFERRRLANSTVIKGVKHWELASTKIIENAVSAAMRELTDHSGGVSTLYKNSETAISIYRGKEAIETLFKHLFEHHRGERYRGVQGDNVYPAWKELLGTESINALNRSIKKNGLIIEAILPDGFFPRVVAQMGQAWAKDFEGRAYRANLIDEKYFKHGAEVFMFRDTVYLASMKEALVIEIKHSEIQKMIALMLEFVQDNSRSVDGNEMLRNLAGLE